MARNITLGNLVTAILARADVANLGTPTAAEVKVLASQSIAWLWGILVRSGHSYFEKTDNWVTDGITGSHALPADFLGKLRVDQVVDSCLSPIREIDVRELDKYVAAAGGAAGAHRIVGDGAGGDNVVLYPTPAAGQSYRLTYIPTAPIFTDVSADATAINGILGFEELLILHCAIKIKRQEGMNASGLESDLAVELQRIEENAQDRELLKTGRILARDDQYESFDPLHRKPPWWEP